MTETAVRAPAEQTGVKRTPSEERKLRMEIIGRLNSVIDQDIPKANNKAEITAAINEYKARMNELKQSFERSGLLTDPGAQASIKIIGRRFGVTIGDWMLKHDQKYETLIEQLKNRDLVPFERKTLVDGLAVIAKSYGIEGLTAFGEKIR